MHEISLCEGILQVLEEQAGRQAYRQVRSVCLEIGALAGVDPEALRFSFEVLSRGTLADGARLEIRELPGEAWCMQCMASVVVRRRYDPCPRCGAYQLQVTGGEQMRIKELEVD